MVNCELLKSKKIIENFKKFIDSETDVISKSTLQNYAVQMFVIVFYAELDCAVNEFFRKHLEQYTFVNKYFSVNALKRQTNLIDLIFLLLGVESAKTIYDSSEYKKLLEWINFRHRVAHGSNSQEKTFNEIEDDKVVKIAEDMLSNCKTLFLDSETT